MLRTRFSFVFLTGLFSIGGMAIFLNVSVGALEGAEEATPEVVIAEAPQSSVNQTDVVSLLDDNTANIQGLLTEPTDDPGHVVSNALSEPSVMRAEEEVPTMPSEPSPVPVTGPVIFSMLRLDENGGLSAFELWNLEDDFINLSNYELRLQYSQLQDDVYVDYECQLAVAGYMRPKQFAAFTLNDVYIDGAYALEGCSISAGAVYDASIHVFERTTGALIERLILPGISGVTTYERKASGSYKTGKFATDFRETDDAAMRVSALYYPPSAVSLRITEVFVSPELCATSDTRPQCFSYIKVENTSTQPVELSSYRLRSGRPSISASTHNTTPLSGVVPAGGFVLISKSSIGKEVALGSSEGTVWFEDAYGVLRYDNAVTPYVDANLVAQRHKAWAYNPETSEWQWTAPSPTTRNASFVDDAASVTNEKVGSTDSPVSTLVPCRADQYRAPDTNRCRLKVTETTSLVPCKEGQYRNKETNRCRSEALATSSVTPCKSGQYRSPETNRCRSVVTATSTLVTCKADQFRNPETGRCKKIASTTSALKPCAANQERNPETNRCRAKSEVLPAATDHPVEPITSSSAGGTTKWWVFGGVVAAAATYAVWEWRRDIANGFRAVLRYGSSRP